MQLKAQSEWMLDQKQAQVMGPGKAFQVMQTVEGTSVFFSISTDNRLYATREVPTGFPGTGWSRIDLCAGILGPQEPRPPTIKSFALGQNPDSLAFDLAVVISIPGKSGDKLYISTGNANTDDAWSRSNSRLGVQWKAVPFDAINSTVDPDKLEIDGVYLMTLPSASSAAGSLTCFVDTLRGTPATNTLRLLDRYYITVGARRAWNKHTLPIDLQADSISSSLGRRFKDRVGGIYTFGDINGRLELIYAPAYDYWNEDNPPSPVRFGLPEQATSMTTCPNSNGNSHLFVSGKQGIFHWAPDQQKDGSTGTRIITTTLVAEAKHLSSETLGNVTALYGISPQGDLFYTTCKVGSEGSAHAWSLPIPLISGVEEYSFFLNKKTEKTTAFAHTTGQHVTQLTQDPVTHDWSSRSILLPSTDVDDVVDLSAFTTRVTVQNDAGGPGAGVDVLFSATSPVAVYINDSYRILRPSLNIKATADSAGTITIVQPTQDMSAVCYKASLASNPSNSLDIDPASKVKSRIASISSGKDLKTATVTRSDGTTSPLLSSDVSEEDCNAAASAIQQLVKVAATLPQDGGMKATPNAKSDRKLFPNARPCLIFLNRSIISLNNFGRGSSLGHYHLSEGCLFLLGQWP